MVVDQIDIDGLPFDEAAGDAPITGHANAPLAPPVALQGMETVSGQVDVLRLARVSEIGQDTPKPRNERSGQPPSVVPLEKRL